MDERFHPAQAALANGDLKGLASLLSADPDLATELAEHLRQIRHRESKNS